MRHPKYDSLECPECKSRLCFIKYDNAHCFDCGYDVKHWSDEVDGYDSFWENELPWDTFTAAAFLTDEELES